METEHKGEIEVIVPSSKNLTKTHTRSKQDLPKYWSKEEINQKLDDVKNPRHKMFLVFLWMSGTRVSEALNVQKKDIDFKNYTIRIRWLKSRKYNERNIPMHPTLKAILEAYTGAMNQEAQIFPFGRVRAWQIVRKCMGGHPHQMRHSFAVNWLRQGADIITLHRILGHKNIQHTMEYLKIVPSDQGKELIKIQFT